jgi:hypothetical protein
VWPPTRPATFTQVCEVTVSNGNIVTFAGNGSYGYSGDGGLAINAMFGDPNGIAVDSAGNVYISDKSNNVVHLRRERHCRLFRRQRTGHVC